MIVKLRMPKGFELYAEILPQRFLSVLFFVIAIVQSKAQDTTALASTVKMKKLSMEQLMDIEVTSISMRPEKLTEVASAVQVITSEDIRRSGVTRLPEALRLVANLQVAQANSHDWAITARGFNGLPSAGGILANKLLVMIDGRTVYNPLYGGVFWDVQNLLIEDIDRIEVVSGPGGTLWGSNAVNGVINIITKSAKDTKGLYASASSGSFLKQMGQARYAFDISKRVSARVYAQRIDQRNTFLAATDKTAKDKWETTQAGFRIDAAPGSSSSLTFQGDFYKGTENDSVRKTITDGQNIMARFTQAFNNNSALTIQAYFDRTWRDSPDAARRFYYDLVTYDADVQYRFSPFRNHVLLSGIAYRHQRDQAAYGLTPISRSMPLYSAFLQDEISVVPDKLKLIIGSKFLHNVFSGYEVQPTFRIAWTPNQRNTVWAAVSEAVRVPTRFDSDVTVTTQKFDSEKVTAYELGYRLRPMDNWTVSIASFFNSYNKLRSLDVISTNPQTIVLANSQKAESKGIEFSTRYQVSEKWMLRGGYTYFDKSIWSKKPDVLPLSKAFEGVDYKHYGVLQSAFDISSSWQFDVTARYFTSLPTVSATTPAVSEYFTFDARVAWKYKFLEVSIVGQNLAKENHTETGASVIPRTIYGRLTWRM